MLNEEKLLFALNDVRDSDLEQTRKRLGYGAENVKKVRPRRVGRVLLLVALLSALFATTAYAAYRISLASLPTAEYRGYTMSSLAGTADSPEGQALQEWLAVLEEHKNDPYVYEEASALGMEYELYQATNPALAKALDGILEKYHLEKWGLPSVPEDEKSFYEAAGVGKLTKNTEQMENDFVSGYVYPVGAFHLEGNLYPAGEKYAVGYQLVRSVKGCFSMAMANIGDPSLYTEWEHTTPDGCTLTLAQRSDGRGGGPALLDIGRSVVFLSLLPETWVDYVGDGQIDGVGDAFITLDFSHEQIETMADSFRWAALEDPDLGMDEAFTHHERETGGSLLSLVDQNLNLDELPELDQYLISTAYPAQIEPYIEEFRLVDYQLDNWGSYGTTGWIAFTGTPKGELDWARVETAAGSVYCRSLCLQKGGEGGTMLSGPSFDMLPLEPLRSTCNRGTEEEPDIVWLGTELKPLAYATLYIQQLDESFTIRDADALEELNKLLEAGHISGNGSCTTWNPLYLGFSDGTQAVVYTLADGSDGVNVFGEWCGYGYGKTLFELFSVPLEAAGYTHHDGILTARLEDDRSDGFFPEAYEIDFIENGPMIERRVLDHGAVRGRTMEYDEQGRPSRDFWW